MNQVVAWTILVMLAVVVLICLMWQRKVAAVQQIHAGRLAGLATKINAHITLDSDRDRGAEQRLEVVEQRLSRARMRISLGQDMIRTLRDDARETLNLLGRIPPIIDRLAAMLIETRAQVHTIDRQVQIGHVQKTGHLQKIRRLGMARGNARRHHLKGGAR